MIDKDQKQRLRQSIRNKRDQIKDLDSRSQTVFQQLSGLEVFQSANCIAYYIHFRSEVRTLDVLLKAMDAGSHEVIVPYCYQETLKLFRLTDKSQLVSGAYGILEPKSELREQPEYSVGTNEVDLFLVPGLVFTKQGDRLGYGKGYYDRLLSEANPDSLKVALAFDCQLVDSFSTEAHDVTMDKIVTESTVISCN